MRQLRKQLLRAPRRQCWSVTVLAWIHRWLELGIKCSTSAGSIHSQHVLERVRHIHLQWSAELDPGVASTLYSRLRWKKAILQQREA